MEVQIFDALADMSAEAANMKARADLLSLLVGASSRGTCRKELRRRGWALPAPRLNDLTRGKLGKFSLDALVNLVTRLGWSWR
jgi:predicted XRE-type DNA-binding protein